MFPYIFYNARDYFHAVTSKRIVYYGGGLGEGKTLLAVATAYELWRRGVIDSIVSTFPMAGRSIDYDNINENFVVVLDEIGKIQDARSYSKNSPDSFLVDLRKRNGIVLAPSQRIPDKHFREVIVMRELEIGNIAWKYFFQFDKATKVKQNYFWLINPKWFFNIYPTKYIVTSKEFDPIRELMLKHLPDEDKEIFTEDDNTWMMRGNIQIVGGGMDEVQIFDRTIERKKTILQKIFKKD